MDATPEPSDEEEESSDEEDDGFGAKKKEVEEDPVARMISLKYDWFYLLKYSEAKAMAEKAMSDPMAVAGKLKFWWRGPPDIFNIIFAQ